MKHIHYDNIEKLRSVVIAILIVSLLLEIIFYLILFLFYKIEFVFSAISIMPNLHIIPIIIEFQSCLFISNILAISSLLIIDISVKIYLYRCCKITQRECLMSFALNKNMVYNSKNRLFLENNNFFLDINANQYSKIIDILCEAGKEPKIKKSNYEGANRDSVSNCLIALNHRGKIEAVTRANIRDVVGWLESIDGLDAQFSENIDDFLEKFSSISDLRLRRISAIEQQLEKFGI